MTDAYAKAGVNISEATRAVDLMKAAVKSTHDARVIAGVGAFGGIFDVSSLRNMNAPVLVASTDGVGTKTKIAAQFNRWNGIGTDIVNHGINDILCQGARPLFFMDYIAASKLEAEVVAAIVSSMAGACRAANCVILGGETAEMPGVYHTGELDVAGTIVGVLEKDKIIDGSRVQAGDALLVFPSNGLHTNGYSLARKTLEHLDWSEVRADLNGVSISDVLLEPHTSYLEPVTQLQNAGIEIRALAHITGGGLWDNVPRVLPNHFVARASDFQADSRAGSDQRTRCFSRLEHGCWHGRSYSSRSTLAGTRGSSGSRFCRW
jgi:phosphoribosylformylglycinamidine cyclo-ligase